MYGHDSWLIFAANLNCCKGVSGTGCDAYAATRSTYIHTYVVSHVDERVIRILSRYTHYTTYPHWFEICIDLHQTCQLSLCGCKWSIELRMLRVLKERRGL